MNNSDEKQVHLSQLPREKKNVLVNIGLNGRDIKLEIGITREQNLSCLEHSMDKSKESLNLCPGSQFHPKFTPIIKRGFMPVSTRVKNF